MQSPGAFRWVEKGIMAGLYGELRQLQMRIFHAAIGLHGVILTTTTTSYLDGFCYQLTMQLFCTLSRLIFSAYPISADKLLPVWHCWYKMPGFASILEFAERRDPGVQVTELYETSNFVKLSGIESLLSCLIVWGAGSNTSHQLLYERLESLDCSS